MRQLIHRALWLAVLTITLQTALGDDRFILRAPPAQAQAIADRHGLMLTSPPNAHGVASVIKSDARSPMSLIAEVAADPDVLGIEGDQTVYLSEAAAGIQSNRVAASNPGTESVQTLLSYFGASVWSSYVNQAAVSLTQLTSAQRIPATGAGIVAVIDTGVDPDQPILQGSLTAGFGFVLGTSGAGSEWSDLDQSTAAILDHAATPAPDLNNVVIQVNQSTAAILDQSTAAILDTTRLPAAFGHGTMVAGIIHLVAPTARIMPLKAFKGDGSANLSDIVQAVYYAVDSGANIINMSFSFGSASLELMKAVNYATAHGVICVASAGNEGIETLSFPAAFHNVIGVASTNNQDARSSFSNYGPALAYIAAPGEGITTLYPGGYYALVSGTSFAAPFVSGGAALIFQVDGDLDQSEVFAAFSNARKLTPDLGYGRLDLYQTLKSLIKD